MRVESSTGGGRRKCGNLTTEGTENTECVKARVLTAARGARRLVFIFRFRDFALWALWRWERIGDL
jgi:hypothetical protein